jgi:predicted peptidase
MKTLAFLMMLSLALPAAAQTDIFTKQSFIRSGDTLRYRLMYPAGYDAKKKYPVVLFLHGAGERGNNNEAQLVHGAKLFSDSLNRSRYPAFVIFPQCPYTDFWARVRMVKPRTDSTPNVIEYPVDEPAGKALTLVSQLIDSFAAHKAVDPKRIYVGGLSMGGMGTFEILWRKPGFFAAAFPICGGGNVIKAPVYPADFPIWIFHGAKDGVVDVNDSRRMAAALKSVNANVIYSEYPDAGHDSWTNAFAEPGLLPWIFEQKKQ